MENETEAPVAQPEEQEGEAPKAEAVTPEEIAELKKRAEVSSQNYERAKKAEAEKKALQEQLALAESQLLDPSVNDGGGDVLNQIASLRAELQQIQEQKQVDGVISKYPQLADKFSEFEEYRKDFPISKIETAAKAFLTEHEMLKDAPKRKGLEDQRGGTRTVKNPGTMTADDVKRLRTNNYKEYLKMLRAGKITLS